MRAPPPERSGDTGDGSSSEARPRPEAGDPRLAPLVAQLAGRLRPVCADWDEVRFQTLVQQIARLKVRWGDAYRTEPTRTD